MTERVAETRTNNLLDELRDYIFSDKTLNDIQFATLKKEASNLPTIEESALIEVLAYCAANKLDLAEDKAMSVARQFSHESFVSSNMIWTMLYLGKPTIAYEGTERIVLY